MADRIDSLGLIHSALWQELQRATEDRSHEWRLCTLATVDEDRADARVMVLREVKSTEGLVRLYTDSRSPKVAQIQRHPLGTLVAWSPRLQWQLRLALQLSVADTGLDVSSRWARVKLSPGAQDYIAPLPPGTPLERLEPERGSREHFAVVTGEVRHIDWLELHPDGTRRARFDGHGAGQWLVP